MTKETLKKVENKYFSLSINYFLVKLVKKSKKLLNQATKCGPNLYNENVSLIKDDK